MPLPSALAVKLAKRGIITGKKPVTKDQKKEYKGTSGCPNKYNIYHLCNYWCDTHWKGVVTPDPKYMRRMQKLLAKYPLPHNWTEVFDKGIGRYYYWDMESDMVSWLPPKHPKARPSESAAALREKLNAGPSESDHHSQNGTEATNETEKERKRYHHHSDKKDGREREDKDKRHRHDDRGRKKSKRDHLDPMDPAAYSDIPQGTWSDGLENNKTRADSTASGVLFQQRPYPAPGEVLASNKLKSKKH